MAVRYYSQVFSVGNADPFIIRRAKKLVDGSPRFLSPPKKFGGMNRSPKKNQS